MAYKIETHCHTQMVSQCGKLDEASIASLYNGAGYSAIVMTDHYYNKYFETLDMPWEDKISQYLSGYHVVKKFCEPFGIVVILGIELRFSENLNDYLVVGIDEQFLYDNPELYNYNLESFREKVMSRYPDIVIVQAHPNRPHIIPQNPDYLDGFEIMNLNPRHDQYADAREYMRFDNKIFTSGSDCHQAVDVGLGGILSDTLPKDSFEYAQLLRSGNFKLIGEDILEKVIKEYEQNVTEKE